MTKLLFIGEVAEELNRVPHTIRQWERDNRLPQTLLPRRDENGWRVWTDKQVKEIKQWIEDEDIRPGKGIIKKEDNVER